MILDDTVDGRDHYPLRANGRDGICQVASVSSKRAPMSHQTISRTSPAGSYLTREQVLEVINQACPPSEYRRKRVLLIVPDATRTCPLDIFFQGIFDQIGAVVAALDVMIALGTHQTLSEEASCHPPKNFPHTTPGK